MIAKVQSATLVGIEGRRVAVEVHIANGLPAFTVVGLPDASCRESRDRVRAALLSSALPWPMRRVTVNLAPSGMRKYGAGLDLPIALGVLVAMGELVPEAIEGCGFVGELGLDGSIRAVPGVLSLVDAIAAETVALPVDSAGEASLVGGRRVFGFTSLRQLAEVFGGGGAWPAPLPARRLSDEPAPLDLADVRGHSLGRRALEIAAAGGHHLLLSGPPGSGKTMLAERLVGLLPALGDAEALEVSKVRSAAGLALPQGSLVRRPPYRAPHHSASVAALLGGGTWARPGEISLATRGALFLDELGEFPVSLLDSLRQPLEEGVIRVARARATVVLPAHFLLVAAMNPCPCGEPGAGCCCSGPARERYARRLSGPLLDRFDLRVVVARPSPFELLSCPPGEASALVAARVATAREAAGGRGVACNAALARDQLELAAPLGREAERILERRLASGALSARGLDRVRRVALTIADLEGSPGPISARQLAEALELRAGRDALVGRRAA